MLHQVVVLPGSFTGRLLVVTLNPVCLCVQQPIWSLDVALDNETIVGEDLVAWVMAGIVHVPRSEVYPTTKVTHRHSDTH